MVAQEFAARHQDRLLSLVLSGTSPAFGEPGGQWQREFLRARLAPIEAGLTPADFAEETVRMVMGPQASADAVALAIAAMATVPSTTYRAAVEALVEFDPRQNLPEIDVPTLVLAGEIDVNARASITWPTWKRRTSSTAPCGTF